LECVDDVVYANVWQTDTILRIDPDEGVVTGEIDASGLLQPDERDEADVLNGIAAIPGTDAFFITGRLWPKTFRVRFVPDNYSHRCEATDSVRDHPDFHLTLLRGFGHNAGLLRQDEKGDRFRFRRQEGPLGVRGPDSSWPQQVEPEVDARAAGQAQRVRAPADQALSRAAAARAGAPAPPRAADHQGTGARAVAADHRRPGVHRRAGARAARQPTGTAADRAGCARLRPVRHRRLCSSALLPVAFRAATAAVRGPGLPAAGLRATRPRVRRPRRLPATGLPGGRRRPGTTGWPQPTAGRPGGSGRADAEEAHRHQGGRDARPRAVRAGRAPVPARAPGRRRRRVRPDVAELVADAQLRQRRG